MLQLKDIVKQYGSGDNMVTALNGVNITFRESEFVSILGHSGCGKTTLLNIVGGLDHYTSGDLIINGVSTKEYKDRDWDAYRNHSIGFIFQSYNLIPHQSVLANVELALTISGVSKSERKKRAEEALKKVGLETQMHKKPNQLSGGQMQRVAIARALINNPDILLADEPTGALDSETSIQVMELLKEIAKDKLVIMVTHNPELAEQYSTRIVRIKDGELTSDSNPYNAESDKPKEAKKQRVSMSFFTAVALSLNNLLTKKGRTLLTAFAGSIGIIGIALILSLSTGINEYIDQVQEETLSSYPLSIMRESADTGEVLSAMMGQSEKSDSTGKDENTVYSNTSMYDLFNTLNSSAKQINNMAKFKEFVENSDVIKERSNAVSYSYDIQMPIFSEDENGTIVKSDINDLYAKALGYDKIASENSTFSSMVNGGSGSMSSMFMESSIWQEMLPDDSGEGINPLIYDQYDLAYGEWPDEYNEVVIILSENNEIPDMVTYALGLKSADGFSDILKAAMKGEEIKDYGKTSWTFDEIMNKQYKMILPCEYYQDGGNGTYIDLTATDSGLQLLYNDDGVGTQLKVSGFIKPNPDAAATMLTGFIGYTKQLTDYVIDKTDSSSVVQAQLNDKENDLIHGGKFKTDDYVAPTDAEKAESAKAFISSADTATKAEVAKFVLSQPTDEQLEEMVTEAMKPENREQIMSQIKDAASQNSDADSAALSEFMNGMTDEQFEQYGPEILRQLLPYQYAAQVAVQFENTTDEQLASQLDMIEISDDVLVKVFDTFTPETISDFSYEDNLMTFGYADLADPSVINIFPKSFADKDKISDEIEKYNDSVAEEDVIHYTDYVALLMKSVTGIISGISYLLIAFVGISLIVSSIMIGIITYISVLERTREIGILRAIGASKHDVSTVFNAETMLIGLTAGIMGILISSLLTIPINLIIHHVTSLDTFRAHVPVVGAIVLVAISMILTMISGLIPSRVASKKDPVVALRTE